MPVFDAGSPSVKKAASPSETGWKEERPARRPWEKEREGKRRDGSGVERERPASEHEGGRQPGRPKEGKVATRKASEEMLEMAAGYSPGAQATGLTRTAGECQGQAAMDKCSGRGFGLASGGNDGMAHCYWA